MSTPKHGLAAIVHEAADQARAAMDDRVDELRQLELDDPLTAEELLTARQELGFGAGSIATVARARDIRRRGRPPGAKNRSTEDLRRYLLQFGTDPLVAAIKLQSENPLVLAELWKCEVKEVIDRQLRARELTAPYMHGKMPVAVKLDIEGGFNLVVPGLNVTADEAERMIAGDAIEIGEWSDVADLAPADAAPSEKDADDVD